MNSEIDGDEDNQVEENSRADNGGDNDLINDGDNESIGDGDNESIGDGDNESRDDGDNESIDDGDNESRDDGNNESDMDSVDDMIPAHDDGLDFFRQLIEQIHGPNMDDVNRNDIDGTNLIFIRSY